MDSSTLIERFRSDVADQARPFLWTDDEVVGYANDAYRMFARFTGGIADFTSSATQAFIVAGDPVGALDPSILRIMSATRLSDGGTIKILNNTDLPQSGRVDYGSGSALRLDNTVGAVNYMIIGMQPNTARWVHVPAADDTAQLVIYRMPLKRITGFDQELSEVDEDHHLHLLKWMKHLAYGKQDADTYDRTKSDEQESAFRVYCAQVVEENDRRKHKARVVSYGGL